MPDLHGWISQQIDEAEQAARTCPPSPMPVETGASDYVATEVRDATGQVRATGLFVTPAAALRRCAADRKILAIHCYAGGNHWDQYACRGCGSDDTGYLVDHTNDCETLIALAEGYGITDEELAQLDRPEWERPVNLYKSYADQMDAYCRRLDDLLRPTNPTSAVPASLRGPNWKPRFTA
ncbi:DUF6221 family protein [Streptomyces sp. NBC_00207]|uniref:DUF6221 family protein n=1 Tax=Streptomyces sp. NBC_00207 TaxID=2903635 RepID=UPI00324D4736